MASLFPREIKSKINSLAFRYTRHLYPNHQEAYERYKEIITAHYFHLTAEGISPNEAIELLADPNHKLMDKLSEVMKKLQSIQ